MKTMTTGLLLLCCSLGLPAQTFFKGVDLSYVNEMEDCGAVYYEGGSAKDPFQIMAEHGANIVRVRLWHTPQNWSSFPTSYSSFNDVATTISRAKSKGMKVLLDFHYSDTWTDPGKQIIPSAWAGLVNNIPALESEMYSYTYGVLTNLHNMGLMPELVQVGNETNGNMLSPEGADLYPVNWPRQRAIINAGIQAVRAAGNATGTQPKIVLHVADPNNGDWWFGEATSSSQPALDFDIIGLSFYPEWHSGNVAQTGAIVANLIATYGKDVMLVEVGVPWTKNWNDNASNMLNSLPAGYGKPSPTGQRNWLIDITTEVSNQGGIGVIYWEPAWVSTGCDTEWATGSHWENATFFDFNNQVIANGGIQFLEQTYGSSNVPPTVTISSPANGTSYQEGTTISVAASTSDADGSVTEVKFYDNGVLLGIDVSAPFAISWTVTVGSHALTAVALDNGGASSTSGVVNVTGTPSGNSTSMHVASIATGTLNVGGGTKKGTATVVIRDNHGNLVSNVNVQGAFSGTFNESASGTTSSNGEVTLSTTGSQKGAVTVNFCVTQATHATLSYNSADNVVTCAGGGARISKETGGSTLQTEVSIYPNPASHEIHIRSSIEFTNFQLMDLAGVTLREGSLVSNTISTEGLKPGMYFLRLSDSSHQHVIRVMKK